MYLRNLKNDDARLFNGRTSLQQSSGANRSSERKLDQVVIEVDGERLEIHERFGTCGTADEIRQILGLRRILRDPNADRDSTEIAFALLKHFEQQGKFLPQPRRSDFLRMARSRGLTSKASRAAWQKYLRDGKFAALLAMANSNDDLKAALAASRAKLEAQKQQNSSVTEKAPVVSTSTTRAPARKQKQLAQSRVEKAVDAQPETLPHNDDAEKGILSSMMQSPAAIEECVAAGVDRHWFYVERHNTIYQALRDMHDSGTGIDFVTLSNHLERNQLLEDVGGQKYVLHLADFVPTSANVTHYIGIVRDAYVSRQSVSLGNQLSLRAFGFRPEREGEQSPFELLDIIESKFAPLRSLNGSINAITDDGATVLTTAQELPQQIVCGVLPRGGKCSIGGASKSNKTWLLLDLALSVATGTSWLGKFETNKGRVLYVNFELQRAFFNKRIQDVCAAHQLKLDASALTVWHLRGRIKEWPRLQAQIRSDQFDLIILDPVYKLLLLGASRFGVRDENSAGHIALLLNEVESLSERTGAATVFGSHFAKGDPSQKESIDRVSGSGVWARDPDAVITFTRLNTEDCFGVDLTLRNYKPVDSFGVRWEFPGFVADISLDPTDLKQRNKGAAEKQHTLAELVELFDRPMLTREIRDVAINTMSERTFYRLWDEGKGNAFLKCKDGKWKVNLEWLTKQK